MRRVERIKAFNYNSLIAKDKIGPKTNNKFDLEGLIKVSGLTYIIGFDSVEMNSVKNLNS